MRLPHTAIDEWQRSHPKWVDTLLVGVLLLPALMLTVNRGFVFVALSLIQLVPLIWRRDRTAVAFAAVSLGCALQLVSDEQAVLPGNFGFLIALYSLSAYEPRRLLRGLGLVVALLGCLLAVTVGPVGFSSRSPLLILFATGFMAAFVVPCWLAGDLMRTRRAYVAEVEERARRLERDRDQQARLAASAERARIAREMHDVVAHSLSVVVAQADGGAYVSEQDPATARKAFETIGTTGREALAEMRRLLGVLGSQDDAATTDRSHAPDYSPQPGLDQLPELLERIRGANLEVTYAEEGERRPLDQGAELVVYRIVQEALTNVLKHAGPQVSAAVSVHWTPQALRILVADDGRGATAYDDQHGNGLMGMRQRIEVYGGSVSARPRPGGGFEVRAELPLTESMGAT